MRAQVWRLYVVVAGAVLVLSAPSVPAQAGERLGLSNDGEHWGPALSHPLFDPALLWVPGDSRTRSFHVRNQTDQAGVLAVDILESRRDDLLKTGGLRITGRAQGGTSHTVRTAGRHRLISDVKVSARSAQQVQVTAGLDGDSGNSSQTRALDLRLRVVLIQDLAGAGDGPGDGTGGGSGHGAGDLPGGTTPSSLWPDGLLADTGGPPLWLLVGGLALVLSGGLVLRRRAEVSGDG